MPAANDVVWLDVLPSMRGFGPALTKQSAAASATAGAASGKSFGKAALAGTAVVAGGAVLATKALYNVGETFDNVSDTIRTGTGASGKALDGLVQSAKNVGRDVPASFDQIGTVVADLNTRLGLTGPTLETLSAQFLEAGRILEEEIDVQSVTGAFSAFKIEGEDTTAAMDKLFQVSQATGVGMNDLGKMLAKNGVIASQLGFSFEDTAALLGVMDKAGVNSRAVMASMQAGLVKLAKDGEAPIDAFKRVTGELQGFIDSGDDASALDLAGKVFGTRGAGQMVAALKSGKVNLDDMAGAAGLSGDKILDVAKETSDMAEEWQLFKNNALLLIEPVATRVFNTFGRGLGWINDKGVPALKDMAHWMRENKTTLKVVAGVISGVLIPAFIAMGVQATIAGAKNVAAWLTSQYAAIKSAALQVAAFGRVTLAWIVAGARATGTAALYVAAFAFMGAAAVKNAAIQVATQAKNAASWVASTAAMVAQRVVMVTIAAATRAWAVTQWLLNAAMRANPIGAVITILSLLAVGLVAAYRRSDTFRAVVNRAWAGIKIAAAVSWAYMKAVFGFLKAGLGKVGSAFAVAKNGIGRAWGAIRSGASSAWGGIKSVFDKMRAGVNRVKDAFGAAKNGIRTAWDKVRGVVKAPIKWAVENVINRMVDGVNRLIPGKGPLTGISTSGWSGGGWTGPGGKYEPAGLVHRDEFVVQKSSRRRIERQHPGVLDYMNMHGRLPGYSKGGRVVPGRGNRHSGYPWATYAGDFPNPIGTPVRAWKSGVIALVRTLAGSYGKHIRMNHNDGTSSLYAHLSRFFVKQGQKVAQGAKIGAVGTTGNSTGPHLHLELMGGPYKGGKGGAPAVVKALSWLNSKFNFAKKLAGWTRGMGAHTGIFGSGLTQFAKNITSRIWDSIKSKVGGVTGTAKNISGKIGNKLRLFDSGGLASGAGLMAKNTIAPERVLSPRQTAVFEQAMTGARKSKSVDRPIVMDGSIVGVLREVAGQEAELVFNEGMAYNDRIDGMAR